MRALIALALALLLAAGPAAAQTATDPEAPSGLTADGRAGPDTRAALMPLAA